MPSDSSGCCLRPVWAGAMAAEMVSATSASATSAGSMSLVAMSMVAGEAAIAWGPREEAHAWEEDGRRHRFHTAGAADIAADIDRLQIAGISPIVCRARLIAPV